MAKKNNRYLVDPIIGGTCLSLECLESSKEEAVDRLKTGPL